MTRVSTVCLAALLVCAAVAKYDVKLKTMKIKTGDGFNLTATAWVPTPKTAGETFPLLVFPNSWGAPVIEYLIGSHHLADHGYVALEYETRGWFTSGGQIDVAGPEDMADASTVITYGLAQAGWHANHSAVAMMGISYGAGISLLAAAHDARVKTAVSMSGWNNLTDFFIGNDSPNVEEISGLIHDAHEHGNLGPVVPQVLADIEAHKHMGSVYAFGEARTPQAHLAEYNRRQTPLFVTNNFLDRLFRPQYMMDMFARLTCPKHIILSQGMHAGAEATGALGLKNHIWKQAERWLDYHLKGVDEHGIMTGPHVEMQLGATALSKDYVNFPTWPAPARVKAAKYYLTARGDKHFGGLSPTPARPSGRPDRVHFTTSPPLLNGKHEDKEQMFGKPFIADLNKASNETALVYLSAPLAASTRLCGVPTMSLRFGANSGSWQVYGYFYDVQQGQGTLLTGNFETRYAQSGWTRVAAGEASVTNVEFAALCRDVPAGHQLGFGIVLYNSLYLPAQASKDFFIAVAYDSDASFITVPVNV
jgi:predicted acyl esterase